MTKQSGLGLTTFSVDDSSGSVEAIKNDVSNFSFSTPKAIIDVTGVDKSVFERIVGLQDFSIDISVMFNPVASPSSHDVFKTVPTTGASRTTTIVVGGVTMTAECLYTDYAMTRADSGEVTFKVPGVVCNGVAPTWS